MHCYKVIIIIKIKLQKLKFVTHLIIKEKGQWRDDNVKRKNDINVEGNGEMKW